MIGKCSDSECKLLASFGYADTRIRFYCKKHKKDNMINVVNPLCLQEGCSTQATFGIAESRKLFCSKHKKVGMLHISKHKQRQVT